MSELKKQLDKIITPKLQKELGISNIMATPKFQKVVVNVGIGSRAKNTKDFSDVIDNIKAITGQAPVIQKSKKAISNFKLRIGMPVGVKVTVRGKRMYSLIDRMINVAFPRIRDFQGFSKKGLDQNGNYSVGIKDCSVFPEINPDDISKLHGIEFTIVTSAKTPEHCEALLKACNFPFKKAPKAAEQPKKEMAEITEKEAEATTESVEK
jgi:large subunit ribosomal protein L5